MSVTLSIQLTGVQGTQRLGVAMFAMADRETLIEATDWELMLSKCLHDRIAVQATSIRSWTATFDYEGLIGVTHVPIILRTSPGLSISSAATSLTTQVFAKDGSKVIFTLPDVSLQEVGDVDWFCVGIYTRNQNNSWLFKEVHSFPDHSDDILDQFLDLLASIDDEIQNSSFDASYSSLPPPTLYTKPKLQTPGISPAPSHRPPPTAHPSNPQTDTEVSMVSVAEETDEMHADFLISHHREVATLQSKLAAAENELRLSKGRSHSKMVNQAVGDSRPLVNAPCLECERYQREARAAKDRLVELEAALVLQDLVGDKAADKLIMGEPNRILSLRCAELEGKSAVQAKLIDELNRTKKQLIASITALPKMHLGNEVHHEVGTEGEDPIVYHIRVQERVLASLRLQLDQLSTQISLATAMKN